MLWHDRRRDDRIDDDDYYCNDNRDDDADGDVGNGASESNLHSYSYSASLSRRERLLAAEMAEQCLRELIEEEDARRAAGTTYRITIDDDRGRIDDDDAHVDWGGGHGRTSPSILPSSSLSKTSTTTSPDLYYLVIRAWLSVDGRADRTDGRYLRHASSLLDLLERRSKATATTTMTMTSSLSSSTSTMRDRDLRGMARCYAIVLDGHCKSKLDGSEIMAEGVLRRMMGNAAMMTESSGGGTSSSGERLGASSIVRHYNNVINRIALGGKANAGREAERLLDELIGLSSSSSSRAMGGWSDAVVPDRNTYNSVMKAYANARGGKREDAISNIERILGIMDGRSLSSGISPDKISYTILLTSYSSGGGELCPIDAGERAEGLLDRMSREYFENGNSDIKPDTVTYNAILKVWYVLTVIIIGYSHLVADIQLFIHCCF